MEEEHLLSLYRDPFALNLVQHNGTTSADTTNTYISHSGILKKTKIPTYNCALPVEMIWEWVTKNPIVTSEKEGLDMTCGTPYSTAAAIRAITASSTKLTSTNVETNTYSSSNSIRTGSKTGLQSGIESQELQLQEFVEKKDKTTQEIRQFQIIYGIKTVSEHMRGLGNDECVKKAMELYQSEYCR